MSTNENTHPPFISIYGFVTAKQAAEWWGVSVQHFHRLYREGKVADPIDLQRAGEVRLWSVDMLVDPLTDHANELLGQAHKLQDRAAKIKQVVNNIMQDDGRRAEDRKRVCPHRKQDAEATQWFDEFFEHLDYCYGVTTTPSRKWIDKFSIIFDGFDLDEMLRDAAH